VGLVETVDPVRTRPRRNQLSQRGTGGAKRLQLPQKLRQLGDIRRDPRKYLRHARDGRASKLPLLSQKV